MTDTSDPEILDLQTRVEILADVIRLILSDLTAVEELSHRHDKYRRLVESAIRFTGPSTRGIADRV